MSDVPVETGGGDGGAETGPEPGTSGPADSGPADSGPADSGQPGAGETGLDMADEQHQTTGDLESTTDSEPGQQGPAEASSDGGNKMPDVPPEVTQPLKEGGLTGGSDVDGNPHPGYIPDASPDDDAGRGRGISKS